MDFPIVLVALLALPFVAAAVIVGTSFARRRAGGSTSPEAEPNHRLQADTAAVQSATDAPPVAPRAVQPARERRAASADSRTDG